MKSNKVGNDGHRLKQSRHPWHRSKTRSSSSRSAAGSKYLGSVGSYVAVMGPPVLGDRLEPLRKATGVRLLGLGQRLEPLGDLLEALVTRCLGEAGVHLGVLVGLALDGRLQVVLGGADRHARHGVAH